MPARKSKPVPSGRSIYVILPETVQVPILSRKGYRFNHVMMEWGRMAAQCAHVVSKMRLENIETLGIGPITTIVKSVRNTKELCRVIGDLRHHTVTQFNDDNRALYGTRKGVLTAICTLPMTPEQVDYALGHLPLWGPLSK